MPVRLTHPGRTVGEHRPHLVRRGEPGCAAAQRKRADGGDRHERSDRTPGAVGRRPGPRRAGCRSGGDARRTAATAEAERVSCRNARLGGPERATRRAARRRGEGRRPLPRVPPRAPPSTPAHPTRPTPAARAPHRRRPRALPRPPPIVRRPRTTRPDRRARAGSEDRECGRQHRDPRWYRDRRGPRTRSSRRRSTCPAAARSPVPRRAARRPGPPATTAAASRRPPPQRALPALRARARPTDVGRCRACSSRAPREAARSASHPPHPPSSTPRVIGRARHARAAAGLRWCSVTGDLSTTGAAPSVFPALEALLPRVAKPVQYVGGELNARVKPWDGALVRWALMYPDAYEVGLPNQGIQILYEILNERADALAERCYAVWPDLEALMREARRARVHRRRAPPARGLRRARASASPPSSATPTCSPRSTWPGSRCTPPTATSTTRWSSPAGTPRSTRSRSRTSSTSRRSATARRSSATSRTSCRRLEGRRAPRRARASCCCGWRRRRAATCRRSTRSPTARTARSPRSCPTEPRVPRAVQKRTTVDLDSWPYPKTPLVPMAETVHERASVEIFRGCTRGCRFCQAGMITRPVRERSLRGIGEMVDAAVRDVRVRRGRAAVAVVGATTRRSPRSPRAWPTATRARTRRCSCRAPASTRSTSTSPTRSAATAAAPGSRSPPRAGRSGSGG